MDETIAHLTCKCGQKFQVLKTTINEQGEEVIEWDEVATAKAYAEHKCEA